MFASSGQAVRAALEFQTTCREETAADPDLPLTIGIGIVVGFAASRFLKASSRKRYEGYQGDRNRQQLDPQLPVASGGDYGS